MSFTLFSKTIQSIPKYCYHVWPGFPTSCLIFLTTYNRFAINLNVIAGNTAVKTNVKSATKYIKLAMNGKTSHLHVPKTTTLSLAMQLLHPLYSIVGLSGLSRVRSHLQKFICPQAFQWIFWAWAINHPCKQVFSQIAWAIYSLP